jgi:hypothetical protein
MTTRRKYTGSIFSTVQNLRYLAVHAYTLYGTVFFNGTAVLSTTNKDKKCQSIVLSDTSRLPYHRYEFDGQASMPEEMTRLMTLHKEAV